MPSSDLLPIILKIDTGNRQAKYEATLQRNANRNTLLTVPAGIMRKLKLEAGERVVVTVKGAKKKAEKITLRELFPQIEKTGELRVPKNNHKGNSLTRGNW